jgi:hypothetical protein
MYTRVQEGLIDDPAGHAICISPPTETTHNTKEDCSSAHLLSYVCFKLVTGACL